MPVLRARSLSPNIPYLYPDSSNENLENKYRRGWYRVDYGGTQAPEMWFLPRFSDRLKFLEYNVDKKMGAPRASSVPPMAENTVRTVAKYTKPSVTSTPSYHYRSLYYPYRYWDTYSPVVGPYSGRLWSVSQQATFTNAKKTNHHPKKDSSCTVYCREQSAIFFLPPT